MSSIGSDRCADPPRGTHFLDRSVNEAMASKGFAVLDQRLNASQVGDLHDLYRSVIDIVGRDGSGNFMPSMMISRPELRARLWDGVRSLLEPVLAPLLDRDRTEVIGGSYVSKPFAPNSARNPHQDPSIFDETRHVSISVWIPLVDTHAGNGTLRMLPGSHRMGNHIRPPDVGSIDDDVSRIALSESEPIEIEAGRMVVIDGAVVHHSPPNDSAEERVSTICALKPVESTMWYVQSERGRPSGTAEVRDVGVEMYRSSDLLNPDLDAAPLVERRAYRAATLSDLTRSRASG